MDAATLGAAAAAITSPRTTRCMASMALAIAVDDNKTSLRTANSLAKALKTALEWAGYRPALMKAGERMMIYDDIRKEYNEALDEVLDLEEKLPWPGEGGKVARDRRASKAQAIHSRNRPEDGSRRESL